MAIAFHGQDKRSAAPVADTAERSAPRFRRGSPGGGKTLPASQARAARRRQARSSEQAVSAWLRELSGRAR